MSLEIDLVSNRKVGLTLRNPILLASGFGGYGIELARWGNISLLGGIVTNPVSLRPWPGADQPRMRDVSGGYLLHTGNQNPGLRRVLYEHAESWANCETSVIVRVCGAGLDDYVAAITRLEGVEGVAGFELDVVPSDASDHQVEDGLDTVRAVREATILPLLVMIPLFGPRDLPLWCVGEGADVLVVSGPPHGLHTVASEPSPLRGQLFGPALLPMTESRVARVVKQVDVPVVARGGIHRAEGVLAYLAAGAQAIQVDSAVLRDPTAPWRILHELEDRLRPQNVDRIAVP